MVTRRIVVLTWRLAAVAALGCSGAQVETATSASSTSASSTSVSSTSMSSTTIASSTSSGGTTVDATGGETTGANACSSTETANGGRADYPGEGCGGCGDGEICVAWHQLVVEDCFPAPDLEVSCEPLPESCSCAEEGFCGEYDCLFELCGTIDCIADSDFVCGDHGPVGAVCEYAGPRYDLEMGLVGDYCSISEQDCPPGFKCAQWYAYSGWGNAWVASCVPLSTDAAGSGGPCETTEYKQGVFGDTCDASSICVGGTCASICAGGMEPVECAPGEVCTPYLFSDVSVCGEACDPLAEGCPGGQLCLPQGDGWLCVDDASGDGGAPGDPCEFKNSCDSGLVCLSYVYFEGCDGEACCSPLCDVTAPNTCPGAMEECILWYEEGMAPEGLENLGVCGIPQ